MTYNPRDDFAKSIQACYEELRKRPSQTWPTCLREALMSTVYLNGVSYTSLQRVGELAGAGAKIELRRGAVYHEQLNIRAADVIVTTIGIGPPPIIDGDGQRHGIVLFGKNGLVRDIACYNCKNGIYVTGTNASATIISCSTDACGTGIVAGGGGILPLVQDCICTRSTNRLGAGDGIQVSEDAGLGRHAFSNIHCMNCDKQGINFKIGSGTIDRGYFASNGETGVLAQVNAGLLILSKCILEHNNALNTGTFNLGLENSAIIQSYGCEYRNPSWGSLACNNVNMSGASRFYSYGDQFIDAIAHHNMVAAIRTNTGSNAAVLQVIAGTLQTDSSTGTLIDCYDATGLALTIDRCNFHSLTTRNLRLPRTLAAKAIDRNRYYRNDRGCIVEIQDTKYYDSVDQLRLEEGTDAHSYGGPG